MSVLVGCGLLPTPLTLADVLLRPARTGETADDAAASRAALDHPAELAEGGQVPLTTAKESAAHA